jgi:hypothetical protein
MTFLAVVMVAVPMTVAAQVLPSSVDLSSELPPVGDQRSDKGFAAGSCCKQWAAAYYLLTHHN